MNEQPQEEPLQKSSSFAFPKISKTWAFAVVIALSCIPIGMNLLKTPDPSETAIVFLNQGAQNIENHYGEEQTRVAIPNKPMDSPVLEDEDNMGEKGSKPDPLSAEAPQTDTGEKSIETSPDTPSLKTEADISEEAAEGSLTNESSHASPNQLRPPFVAFGRGHQKELNQVESVSRELEFKGKPFVIYNHDFISTSEKTKLTIVVVEMGYDPDANRAILEMLPEVVTYGVLPTGEAAQQIAVAIREKGAEYLLMVPMEPMDYPASNPGPDVLLTNETEVKIKTTCEGLFSRYSEFMGVMPFMGNRFMRSESSVTPFLRDIHTRGLCYFETRYTRSNTDEWSPEGLPYRKAQFDIQNGLSRVEVKSVFDIAKYVLDKKQNVIITVVADKGIVEQVNKWIQSGLPEHVELVPLSEQMELPLDHLDALPLESH